MSLHGNDTTPGKISNSIKHSRALQVVAVLNHVGGSKQTREGAGKQIRCFPASQQGACPAESPAATAKSQAPGTWPAAVQGHQADSN